MSYAGKFAKPIDSKELDTTIREAAGNTQTTPTGNLTINALISHDTDRGGRLKELFDEYVRIKTGSLIPGVDVGPEMVVFNREFSLRLHGNISLSASFNHPDWGAKQTDAVIGEMDKNVNTALRAKGFDIPERSPSGG